MRSPVSRKYDTHHNEFDAARDRYPVDKKASLPSGAHSEQPFRKWTVLLAHNAANIPTRDPNCLLSCRTWELHLRRCVIETYRSRPLRGLAAAFVGRECKPLLLPRALVIGDGGVGLPQVQVAEELRVLTAAPVTRCWHSKFLWMEDLFLRGGSFRSKWKTYGSRDACRRVYVLCSLYFRT